MGGLSYPLCSDNWPYGYVGGAVRGAAWLGHDGARPSSSSTARASIRYIDIHNIGEQPPTEQDHGGPRQAEVSREKALELSRYCVPFTPFKRKLEESLVCLVSTAGVRAKSDAPFNVEATTRSSASTRASRPPELAVGRLHYDHGCIEKDVKLRVPARPACVRWRERDASRSDRGTLFDGVLPALPSSCARPPVPQLAAAVSSAPPDAVLLNGG